MPEVSGSSSASAASGAATFDLSTQKGVADLLRHVRGSSLPPTTKTTVRELVLRYTREGNGSGVREELESMLSDLSLATAPTKPTPATDVDTATTTEVATDVPAPAAAPAGGRRVPVFGVSSGAAAPQPTPVPVAPTPAPQPAVPAPTPTVPTPPPAAPPQPTSAPAPEPAPAAPPQSAAAPTPSQDHSARVQEIKREVTALVGNPVNLVAADNEVGKHYMSALLEAMKKINGGTRIEVTAAMNELETAFVAVQKLAEQGLAPAPKPQPQPAPTPVPAAPTPTPQPAAPTPPVPEPQPTPTPAPAAPTPPPPPAPPTSSVPVPEPTPAPKPSDDRIPPPPPVPDSIKVDSGVKENLAEDISTDHSSTWASEAVSREPVIEKDAPENKTLRGAPLQDIPNYGYSKPSRTIFSGANTRPPIPAAPRPQADAPGQGESVVKEKSPTPPPPPAPATAKVKPASSPVTPPKTDGTPMVGMNSELMTPEITSGLEQLLSEWKIFKGSGLFGMGPGGIDHPLYVKMKEESMLAITNGTFDGATPEVQQSIADYINGWRYEQSIVPQHSESFEHFLRRVVRKVLKDASL